MTDTLTPAEIARRRASWERVNAKPPKDVAHYCCPDVQLVQPDAGPPRWRCDTHDRWGWV